MTDASWHDRVTASIGGAENYGKGIKNNPWPEKQATWARRAYDKFNGDLRVKYTEKIGMIFEPRFITGVETCELMEALITMVGATQILELGMCTGFGTLHFLRAIVGVEGAKVVSIDARPTHDREFFDQPEIAKHFEFIEGWTPQTLTKLHGRHFDFVFVDSAHDIQHTVEEVEGLKPITKRGTMFCFHDVPEWQTMGHHTPPPVRIWLEEQIKSGNFTGLMLPSPRQLDCIEEYGPDYDTKCSPGLAVLIRQF